MYKKKLLANTEGFHIAWCSSTHCDSQARPLYFEVCSNKFQTPSLLRSTLRAFSGCPFCCPLRSLCSNVSQKILRPTFSWDRGDKTLPLACTLYRVVVVVVVVVGTVPRHSKQLLRIYGDLGELRWISPKLYVLTVVT